MTQGQWRMVGKSRLAWQIGFLAVVVAALVTALPAARSRTVWQSAVPSISTGTTRGVSVVLPGRTIQVQDGSGLSGVAMQLARTFFKLTKRLVLGSWSLLPLGLSLLLPGIIGCGGLGLLLIYSSTPKQTSLPEAASEAATGDTRKVRVVVAESQPQVRYALRVMLERRPDMCIVGEAVVGDDLLALAGELKPDMVLLSWGSPGLTADDLPSQVAEALPGAWLIVLSERQNLAQAALAAGAQAFVDKGTPPQELSSALDACARALAI